MKAVDAKYAKKSAEDFLEDEPDFDTQLDKMGIFLGENKWQAYV